MKIKVLDDGYVELIDYFGTDSDIAKAARCSYGNYKKEMPDDNDANLLEYMMKHKHTSPFEMCQVKLKFFIRVPLYVWQQFLRHRTAKINQVSYRYTEADCVFHSTLPDDWRTQSLLNKQTSSHDFLDESIGSILTERESELYKLAYEVYKERLSYGVAREQARKCLPVALYTEAVWSMDLHNLIHFLELRFNSRAQYEIIEYASAILTIIEDVYPITTGLFKKYRLNGL